MLWDLLELDHSLRPQSVLSSAEQQSHAREAAEDSAREASGKPGERGRELVWTK